MRFEDLPTAPSPRIAPGAWVAPTAVVVGDVTVAERASVWHGCVLRGDIAPILIGEDTNVQDLTVVHVDVGQPAIVGARVGIGHRAVIHGCEIEDDCLIGMGAIVLSGARIGQGSLVAAGAVVTEGMDVPAGRLVAGVPARVVREVDEELRARMRRTVEHYGVLKEGHRAGRWRTET
ncbi:MAG: gamma carbonic anhydrase family protein [Gemmatimonadota bacterium]